MPLTNENELDFPLREYSDELDLHINDFVAQALESDGIDPYNASRLIALNALSSLIDHRSYDGLWDLASHHDGEPIPGSILAPALRVRDDFKEVNEVYVQPREGAKWQREELFAVEPVEVTAGEDGTDIVPIENAIQVVDKVRKVIAPLYTGAVDRTLIGMHPKSLRLFSVEDYEILKRPTDIKRRPQGSGVGLRTLIQLSHFDEHTDDATPRQVLRHFNLLVPADYRPKRLRRI